jgi:predicted aspartyl protease
MIVDTGASGTFITQAMAEKLSVVADSEVTADTASAKGVKFRVGKIKSIAVAGVVAKDVSVAIAGPDLDTGLLGHDFFGNYDITIKRDVIEFQARS